MLDSRSAIIEVQLKRVRAVSIFKVFRFRGFVVKTHFVVKCG